MKEEVLIPRAKELWSKLANFNDQFYLAGGTALALQIGHRISIDFDLFSETEIKKTLLKKVETVFSKQEKRVLVNNRKELTLMIDGVKFTFLCYPFPKILPLEKMGSIQVLSVKEIFATKAYTIGRRGALKDYIDIYTGLKMGLVTLVEIIELANQKYGELFNDRLFLEQLIFLADIEEVDITMLDLFIPTKDEMIKYFSELIKELDFVQKDGD